MSENVPATYPHTADDITPAFLLMMFEHLTLWIEITFYSQNRSIHWATYQALNDARASLRVLVERLYSGDLASVNTYHALQESINTMQTCNIYNPDRVYMPDKTDDVREAAYCLKRLIYLLLQSL